jgi:dihydropyrimidine dehydrogenase (NAD+) subunit PreT
MTALPDIAGGRLDADALARNFSDLHPAFSRNEARVAAERCLFCYDAPCVKACPTSIDIPLFIREIMTGNTVGAARTILGANIMGGMCARVCPTETLCEEACVKEASEGRAVEIGNLQRYATDDLFARGQQLFKRGASTGKRVAVVGAGPAGLACAHKLATLGHEVVVFEAREKSGGLNEYGIAAYKSTNDFAQREVDYITAIGGIDIRHGKRLGSDVHLAELTGAYDAVFLGMGLGDTNELGLQDGVEGVIEAVGYIGRLRQAKDLASLPVGRRIVVIGGGMTAIDIASQTKRLGAEVVTIAYRRSRPQMNASDYEQELAQTDGVLIRYWLKPARLIVEGGKLAGVELEYTREEGGKLVGTGEMLVLECDQLFTAIGQTFLPHEVNGVPLRLEKGRLAVDAERRTSVPGIWAGGDCIAGGQDLTVAAVEDGKQAAHSIDRVLKSQAKAA